MPSLPIIEHLDVVEDVLSRFVSRGVVLMIDQLTLECAKETFHAGVIPAVTFATHAGNEAVLSQAALIARRGILTAAVRMVHEPRGRGR